VVVPVTFQAFGELHYGYELEARTHGNNLCKSNQPANQPPPPPAVMNEGPSLGMSMALIPRAKVNVVASAAVGVNGAQAGVRGRIALLEASLPLRGSMDIVLKDESLKLLPKASADLNVGALSGSLSAFAEVGSSPFIYTAEKEIFSWGGISRTYPLWQLDTEEIHLAAFSRDAWKDWVKENQKTLTK